MVTRRHGVIDLLGRLVVDDAGQDLIEYALLSGFIGVGGFALFSQIGIRMGAAYDGWLDAVYQASGETPPPGGP
jgi:Flp pilus assembly pilin Flp